MGGWRVGDRLQVRDDPVEIVGFVLGVNRGTVGDQFVEFALFRYANGTEGIRETADLGEPTGQGEDRGPTPFDDVAGWRLSATWVERFNRLLQPWPGEPNVGLPVAQFAPKDGEHVLVTGGTVRDALRGATQRSGDVDLIGTLRPPAFRDLVAEVEVLPYGGRKGAPDVRWHLRTTGPERFVTVLSPDERHTVDYATMRIDYRPHLLSSATPVWIYGTSLKGDAMWRDISCNALVYDPEAGRLYDPTEDGLRDLGLKPSDLEGDPDGVEVREIVLRPIALPENAPTRHVALHALRVVLLLVRLAAGDIDTRPAEEWVRRHAGRIEHALDLRDSDGDQVPLITKELRSLPHAAKKIDLISRHDERLSRLFGDLWPGLRSTIPTGRPAWALGGQQQGPTPVGSALRVLKIDVQGRWAAMPGIVGPRRPTRKAVARYFWGDFVGYEHAVEDVVVDGQTVADALVLRPAHDEDGVRYLELDDALSPFQPSEEMLAHIRRQDVGTR